MDEEAARRIDEALKHSRRTGMDGQVVEMQVKNPGNQAFLPVGATGFEPVTSAV